MERGRRAREVSDDKRSTSQAIQRLAAERERRALQQQTVKPSSVHQASTVSLPSESSGSEADDIEDSPLGACGSRHPSARSRLVRRDTAPQAQQQLEDDSAAAEDDVNALAGMVRGIALGSNRHAQQPGAGRTKLQLHQRPSSSAEGSSSSTANPKQPVSSRDSATAQQRSRQTVDLTEQTTDEGSSDSADETAAEEEEESDDDDEVLAYVPRSRGPAPPAAAATKSSAAEAQDLDETSDDAAGHYSEAGGGSSSSEQGETDDEQGQAGSSATATAASGPSSSSAAAAAAAAAGSLVLEGGFCLDAKVSCKLYPHQVEGVKWLWSLHRMRKGGILADDMGLGKTMQCSAFLAGSLRSKAAVRGLVIAPKTLLAHWEKELRVCGLAGRTYSFYGSSEGERAASLRAVTGRGGVMLTTYGMVLHNAQQLREGLGAVARDEDEHEDDDDPFESVTDELPPGRRILWDYIILDEGHKIKNSRTQLAQRLRTLRAAVRVIISGTPVQNNLGELHSLLDFAVPGLLGGPREFKLAFEKPITSGQDRVASWRVRELGAAKAAELRKICAPFMLRREKKDVLGDGSSSSSSGAGSGGTAAGTGTAATTAGTGGSAVVAAAGVSSSSGDGNSSSSAVVAAAAASKPAGPAPMGSKHDLVVWLVLQPLQRHIYEAFLHSDAVKAALNSSRSPLAALTVLKKVCDHPALLSERATNLVLSAASKQKKHSKQGSSAQRQQQQQQQRRSSLDDFIVDDDDEEDDISEDDSSSSDKGYSSEGSEGSDDETDTGHNAGRSGKAGQKAGSNSGSSSSRAAVAASLDDAGFSDDFISWAAAEGLETRLLEGVGKKGLEASCKTLFVAGLLEELVSAGHRTLVFSQSRVMLDILQAAVVSRGWSFCRIDGSMASTDARQAEVERFQAPGANIPVFLLTTQVGGLGLTLTAANRVVIVDPSWNPATDNQSVDRAYRIGQSRDVIVYRLVTCGTVEEKIYRKQVFKGGLSKAGMEEGVQLRYFTHQELHEVFKWDPSALKTSETQQLLRQQHSSSNKPISPDLASHIAWVEGSALCAGTSEHGLLFSHQDPEGKHLQINDPKYQNLNPGSAAGALRGGLGAQRGGRSGSGLQGSRPVVGGGAAAGPSAAELSSMLSSLNISPSSRPGGGGSSGTSGISSAAAGPSGQSGTSTAAAANAAAAAAARREALQAQIKLLEAQLSRVTTDIATVGARLPDGGSKLLSRQQDLQDALNSARQQLQQLAPQQPAAATDTAGPAAAAAAVGSRPDALADITNEAVEFDQGQQQQQCMSSGSAAAAAAAAAAAGPSLQMGSSLAAGAAKGGASQKYGNAGAGTGAAGNASGSAAGGEYTFPSERPQQQQQPWNQQLAPAPPLPPPRQQQQQYFGMQPPPPPPPQQQQQWQQEMFAGGVPPPPPPPRQQQQQPGPRGFTQSISSRPTGGAAHSGSTSSSSKQASSNREHGASSSYRTGQLPEGLDVQTLDGRVPTLAELKQRKHVLKKALQKEDQLKAQLQAEGKQYSSRQQQQWVAMYEEYKEVKAVLLRAEGADADAAASGAVASQEAAAAPAAAAAVAAGRRQDREQGWVKQQPVEMIDLT